MELNLDLLDAATLRVVDRETVSLVLVGCGGSGSWLAPAVVRTARLLIEKLHKQVQVVFVDPDFVEAKNCYRQNFAEFEIGQSKAMTLARRYGLAWGLDVLALPRRFDVKLDELLTSERTTHYGLAVVIGCVDNAPARAEVAQYIANAPYGAARWWLDCGNSRQSGQVILGGFNNREDQATFPIPGYCTRLPLPSQQHPELLADGQESELEDEAGLSCADLAVRGEQGLAVNQMVAAIAGDYLLQMLVHGTLSHFQTYFDQGSGAMRSTYITEENLERYGVTALQQQQAVEGGDYEEDDDEERRLGPGYEDDDQEG